MPAGANSRPVSDGSRNAGSESGPVSGDGSIGGSNSGRLGGRSVRDSVTGDLRSGSVSDASVGAVHDQVPPPAPPVAGETFPQFEDDGPDSNAAPVFDLEPLAEELRQLQPLSRQALNDDAAIDAPIDEPSNEGGDDPDDEEGSPADADVVETDPSELSELSELSDRSDLPDLSDPSDDAEADPSTTAAADDADVAADTQAEPINP